MEPVFLLAEGVDIPQLQRVIVAVGDDVAMEPTIDQAMRSLFGDEPARTTDEALPGGITPVPADTVARIAGNAQLERIRTLWGQLQDALEARDWSRYGALMEELEEEIGD